jgi:hypothetical protein
MLPGVAEFVILGATIEGEEFQPPEWTEHLCNLLGTSGPDGLLYSSYVHPVTVGGVKSVVVRVSLEFVDEKAFNMIKQFVVEHRLQIRAGRGSRDAEEAELHPDVRQERRSPKNNGW